MPGIGRRLVGIVLAALGVVGFASTFVVAGELTRHCGVTPMAMTVYFTPVAALAIGCGFFGEKATSMQLLGTLLICVAARVEFKGGRRK